MIVLFQFWLCWHSFGYFTYNNDNMLVIKQNKNMKGCHWHQSHKSRVEGFLMEQDTIENVSWPKFF